MSKQPKPTPTDTIAKAVLAIASDLSGDGAMTAECVLVEAAKRLTALQAKADAMELERDALKSRIAKLTKAISLVFPHCEHLHHGKEHRHSATEPCPVEALFEELER